MGEEARRKKAAEPAPASGGRRAARVRRRWPVVLALATALGGCAGTAGAQNAKAILLLHSYGADAPFRYPFDEAFARVVRESPGVHPDLYIETIDSSRFEGDGQSELVRRYLRERYRDKHLAVVAAVFDRAFAYALQGDDPLFPGVPVVASLTSRPDAVPAGVSVIWQGPVIGTTAALALRLHPATQHIALIDAAPPAVGGDAVHAQAVTELATFAPRADVISIQNQPLDVVLDRVRMLPPHTVILMVRQLIGRMGQPTSSNRAVSEVIKAANAPVYVTADQQIGSGAVGGSVVSLAVEAERLASLSLRVAANPALKVAPAESTPVPIVDWRQLRRWGIRESQLPPGSAVLFREPGVWELYQGYIVGGALLLLLQTALIAGLIAQRARRRRTAVALRRSFEENRDLAGRLIDAQEAERTRIARDLHDDLSQQLAGLGIMLNALGRKVEKAGAAESVGDAITALEARTSAVAASVRTLSHELHPSVLEHAGLTATLRRHCEEVESLHRVRVAFEADESIDGVRPEVALCVFRVVQEALANAVRHGRAREIRVRAASRSNGIELDVMDDGIGFDLSALPAQGLGLRSIRERVRLVYGHVTVDSRAGAGTTLTVRVPASPPLA